jgi:hypothetical protein
MYPNNPYQQPQVNSQQPVQQNPGTPNHFYINQEFKIGRESFAVTDGQNLICVAKKKLISVKDMIDVYRDDAATQLIFSIQQEKVVALSKVYNVLSASGQKMGSYKLQAMQFMKEHWDIFDANNNPIGVIDQDATTAIAGRMGGMMNGGMEMGSVIPQKFIAQMNNQPVCIYQEEINIGLFFKMDIDFSPDMSGMFDRTLGIAGAIILASKHMQTK